MSTYLEEQRTPRAERAESFAKLADTAVSHVGFRCPDVAAMRDFYIRVLGMAVHAVTDAGAVRLGWGTGHHVLELSEGEAGLAHYGFEVRDTGGLDAIAARLTAAGIPFEPLDPSYVDDAEDEARGIVVSNPDGTPVHFHAPVRRNGENAADTGRRPIKYQHITIGTADVERQVDFWLDVIGFRETDRLATGDFVWIRSNKDHHTQAIVNTGVGGNIDHYSYDLAEWEDFKAWSDRLTDLDVDVTWGPGRHGPGNNLFVFFDDPIGNHIELSAEMEKFYDGHVSYTSRQWSAGPKAVNLWGGQGPTWRKGAGKGR